ncbi:MAG: enterotoxin [Acidobacteriota bacterium]
MMRSSRVFVAQARGEFQMHTDVIAAEIRAEDSLHSLEITDRLNGRRLEIAQPFIISLSNGRIYRPGDFQIVLKGKASGRLDPNPAAARLAERIAGYSISFPMESKDHTLRAAWSLEMRDGANYVRESLTITAVGQDAAIARVKLIDSPAPDARVSGSVKGSPIVAGNFFLGVENPLSQSRVADGRAMAWMDRELPLLAGQSVTYSAVIGVGRPGQMRRDFLAYLERERAHPYRTFLHYNSWYDLGYFNPYDEAGALNRIHAFGEQLTSKRGVKLDSFLFDDGWDKHNSLWGFNSGFPDGFAKVRKAAEQYGADPGVWMSPWGGYDGPKRERISFGKAAGYEIVDGGYALSGPKYYAAFRNTCLKMMREYGVNQFKFDGTGNVNSVVPGSRFDSDFAAMMHLIGEIRTAKPDVFINLTTGTWPSPFWLMYADSIWRGGDDDSTAGVGPYRERWITYRDEQTYQNVVQNGPLYPLNSLMLHGMIFAQHHRELNKDPQNDFRNEVRSYFGTGTQLQEMYITPSLLSTQNWDDLAEAANWSRANADVLKDTHWIGGDPARLAVYGWASWSPRMGILVLRNPSDKPQTIRLRLQDAFELPRGAAQEYKGHSPWKSDALKATINLKAQETHAYQLAPFEVMTLDFMPRTNAAIPTQRVRALNHSD